MKIAIPLDNDCVSQHFGRCSAFALYDADEAGQTIRSRTTLPAPPHEPGLLPKWLYQHGAEVVITGGMGPRAATLFEQQGIRVVLGAPTQPADEVIAAFLSGTLSAGANTCDH